MSPAVALLGADPGADDPGSVLYLFKTVGIVLTALSAVATATWGVAVWWFRGSIRTARGQADHWKDQAAHADKRAATHLAEADEARAALAHVTTLKDQLHAAEKAAQAAAHELDITRGALSQAEQARDRHREESEQLQLTVGILRDKAGVTADELDARSKALARLERRMHSALKLEGQLWNARALQARPKFRELARRRRAIVSVLNLKGGVGKTTVTAHLGAAFARRGYRTLLLDLDLQGSLTTLFLDKDKIEQLHDDDRLTQHFLNAAAEDKRTKVTEYVQEVFGATPAGGCLHLVGATDNLAYAELNLTMRWLMGTGARDTRFLLRKALHLMSVTDEYDLVLIDCPPLVSISCVNALAASDYLLIPTTLSRRSAERVPKMLQKVIRDESFVRHINPKLQVLGLVANRTYPTGLTNAERDDWKQLAGWCRDAYGADVRQCPTAIPDLKEVRESERAFTAAGTGGRLDAVFRDLAADLEGQLPHECGRAAEAHS